MKAAITAPSTFGKHQPSLSSVYGSIHHTCTRYSIRLLQYINGIYCTYIQSSDCAVTAPLYDLTLCYPACESA